MVHRTPVGVSGLTIEHESTIMADRILGKVKWFNEDKGYGFIEREDGGEDVFLHHSALDSSGGFATIAEDTPVEFEVEAGPKGPKAAHVQKR